MTTPNVTAPETPAQERKAETQSTVDADTNTPVVATSPPKKKRKYTKKKYRVAFETEDHQSVSNIVRSSPKAAASDAVRANITKFTLREDHTIWVKSRSKSHAFTVRRDYDDKKFRRFTLVKKEPSPALIPV